MASTCDLSIDIIILKVFTETVDSLICAFRAFCFPPCCDTKTLYCTLPVSALDYGIGFLRAKTVLFRDLKFGLNLESLCLWGILSVK